MASQGRPALKAAAARKPRLSGQKIENRGEGGETLETEARRMTRLTADEAPGFPAAKAKSDVLRYLTHDRTSLADTPRGVRSYWPALRKDLISSTLKARLCESRLPGRKGRRRQANLEATARRRREIAETLIESHPVYSRAWRARILPLHATPTRISFPPSGDLDLCPVLTRCACHLGHLHILFSRHPHPS